MFELTGKDFYQNIEKMNTETENAKKTNSKDATDKQRN